MRLTHLPSAFNDLHQHVPTHDVVRMITEPTVRVRASLYRSGNAHASHVKTSITDQDCSWSGKEFSQNYKWSFDYVRWRSRDNGSAVRREPLRERSTTVEVYRRDHSALDSR